MLDIKLIRENPELVRKNIALRGNPESLKMFEELIETDKNWRQNLARLNDLRHDRKVCTVEIATLKKAAKNADAQVQKAKAIDAEITLLEKEVAQQEEKTRSILMQLPNLLHETVPIGQSDADNVEITRWGSIPKFNFPVKNHIDLGVNLDIIDLERAGKVSGARFFFFKGAGVLLDMALMQFALETLSKKGYTLIEPPYLMKREPYEGVTALADFADVLYKIENEDLYLIATSEHPMA
ncbi:MAG: serine--tRNA ligase, partial [Candidatus Bathyarchaeia archaeon]